MHWEVSNQESGMKLLSFLKEKLTQYSARQLKKAIESNCCQMNGKIERFASAIVGTGDRISFQMKELDQSWEFESERVLYEDTDVLAYNKPAGLSSESEALLCMVRSHCPNAHLLHRLDRDTTGVLMFTKNPQMHEAMVNAFRQQKVEKSYLALVDGVPSKRAGIVDNYLGKKHSYQGQAIWGKVNPNQGLHAITEWQLAHAGKDVALIKCFPKTGRTHQLRVHLSEMQHPILGDYQYGRQFRSSFRPHRYLLHAWQIEFDHPLKDTQLKIEAPIPEDFHQAFKTLFGKEIEV